MDEIICFNFKFLIIVNLVLFSFLCIKFDVINVVFVLLILVRKGKWVSVFLMMCFDF